MSPDVRVVAFYLPQFHPTPENDAWWGKGFTEWTNVTRAQPLFEGHQQPHLPADLGFYDLRVPQVRHQQAALAKQYGIDAFCYHYYWFSGQRLLRQPLDDLLADSDFDLPYCLCWANETWSRRWNGAQADVLMPQRYEPGDEARLIEDLLPHFRDPRYLRVDDAPVWVVYAPQQMPDPAASVQRWRDAARTHGIERLYLCAALTHGNTCVTQWGFDAAVQFPPNNQSAASVSDQLPFFQSHRALALPYAEFARGYLRTSAERTHPCVVPDWDNTARRGERATFLVGATPNNFAHWLQKAIVQERAQAPSASSALVFVNAWNEWAEGCHLEPDQKNGHAYLAAVQLARTTAQASAQAFNEASSDFPDTWRAPATQPSLMRDLAALLRLHGARAAATINQSLKRFPRLRATVLRLIQRS